jgi:ATP-dependent DNA helicase RecG
MIFEELFVLQVGLALKRRRFRKRIEGISFTVGREFRGEMETLLPFELTRAQKKVLEEIYSDLANSQPMNRLLQGDVGSGKTVVALIAALAAIRNGYQAALMAPTEILAEQHFKNIQALLGGRDGAVECVTSANRNKAEIRQRLADGRIQLVVGTHALIQEGIQFKKLGLAVVDEQHRFGVVQRAALIQKGMNCHTLVMTATPIPRTLAMTLYGDLDLSVINELPKGRRPIRTEIYSEREEETVYGLVEREIQKGRQVYFVYPLVEESEKTDLKAATDMTEHLKRDVFPHRTVALLHGRMPSPEKDRVMARFKNGGIDILVATTVIEVGIDVPNATVMVVEHAERFGLSQLHQLRGRVGRGSEESHCLLLVGSPLNDTASARLTALKETADGFRIAEKDLEIRGSGDFFGTKQSGLPELRIANLVRDHKVLEYARKEAFQLVDRDPHLSDAAHDVLREILKSRWKEKFDLGDIA